MLVSAASPLGGLLSSVAMRRSILVYELMVKDMVMMTRSSPDSAGAGFEDSLLIAGGPLGGIAPGIEGESSVVGGFGSALGGRAGADSDGRGRVEGVESAMT